MKIQVGSKVRTTMGVEHHQEYHKQVWSLSYGGGGIGDIYIKSGMVGEVAELPDGDKWYTIRFESKAIDPKRFGNGTMQFRYLENEIELI